MASDWYDIKFLESATNVRELIGRSNGRTPSASIAREISVCLQQGRLYFEAAEAAPIQIKPLLIYYGVVAFAQAVVVATQIISFSTLRRGHGLSDITPANSGVEELALRFENAGTFQEFNDAIAPLGRIWYFDDAMPRWFEKPFGLSGGLSGQQVTIKDILSRMPNLFDEYRQTFGSPADTAPITLHFQWPNNGRCTLRIDDPDLFTDRASLIASVLKWRQAYPFLNRWRFTEASHAWGRALLIFDNVEKGEDDDLLGENLVEANNRGFVGGRAMMGGERRFIPASDILPPLSGGYVNTSSIYAIQPLAGIMLPEHSLQVLGSFLLGSLVRYRPQVWQNAISRSFTAQSAADDRSLSLIEKFLDDVLSSFPRMVVRVIDYQRTR
ncbi:MAG: YaaC family protein [Xanthobacteraceae bacterium]